MGKLHGAKRFRVKGKNPVITPGKNWDVIARFGDFQGADSRRDSEIKRCGKTMDVKVQRLKTGFVVKAREKQGTAAA